MYEFDNARNYRRQISVLGGVQSGISTVTHNKKQRRTQRHCQMLDCMTTKTVFILHSEKNTVARLANSGFGHSFRDALPFLPVPSLPFLLFPSPPSFPFPVGPTPKPARGSGGAMSDPQWVWGKAPADKRFGAYI